MNILHIIILIILLAIIYYFINIYINKKENFINLLQVFNNLLDDNEKNLNQNNDKKINQNNDKNKKEESIKIKQLFKKFIIIRYNKEKNNKATIYYYNYKKQLYMNFHINLNNFVLYNNNNELIGKMINNKYNNYTFNLSNIYENTINSIYHFSFQKDYNNIRIYPDDQNIILYIKKYKDNELNNQINKNNHILYKLYVFEKDVGLIYKNGSYYKIEVEDTYKKYLNLYGIGIGLIIKMN